MEAAGVFKMFVSTAKLQIYIPEDSNLNKECKWLRNLVLGYDAVLLGNQFPTF
jgi:hypothetical protein